MSNHVETLRWQAQNLLKTAPRDIDSLCNIGKQLLAAGLETEKRKCYKAAVETLRAFVRAGDVNAALNCEILIYKAFVRTVEDEQHYHRCFLDWKDDLAALARRNRLPQLQATRRPGHIAFVMPTGHILGHTEVLLKLLGHRRKSAPPDEKITIYVLDSYDEAFVARCAASGTPFVSVRDASAAGDDWGARFDWLQRPLATEQTGICIWVSVPVKAAYALGFRLAPVQIFWSLRFHPIKGQYIDGYITYGAPHETERTYGTQKWIVCPPPLTIQPADVDAAAVQSIRSTFPEQVLLGTIAREDKINAAAYLQCVTSILQKYPQTGYVWTGKQEHPAIVNAFREAGVLDRCHFIGWVDVSLYARVLDIFLETFPLGGGISGYYALAAGVPLLSYLSPYTVLGIYRWRGANNSEKSEPRLAGPPLLCAANEDEYVEMAGRLVSDAAYRATVGIAGRQFFEQANERGNEDTIRFFDTVYRIAADKGAF